MTLIALPRRALPAAGDGDSCAVVAVVAPASVEPSSPQAATPPPSAVHATTAPSILLTPPMIRHPSISPKSAPRSGLGCGRFGSPLGCGPGMFRTRQGWSRVLGPLTAALACLCLPSAAGAHAIAMQPAAAMLGPASCGGAAIEPSQVFTGEFSAEQQGSFVLLPFDVPAGTTAVRVKYCWDPPIGPFTRHTLDLGLYEARDYPGQLYGADQFRGWGGSSHPDVIVSN